MKKITELKVKKQTVRETRDPLGNRVRTPMEIELPRKIKTIQGGARFGHFLVDLMVMAVIIFLLYYSGILTPQRRVNFSGSGTTFSTFFDLSGYLLTFGYYCISEALMGRTIGKMVTNSYVIDEYAKKPDFGTIAARSLCRLVPFETFSCLGECGWHDTWSKTYVVSKKEWESLKRELSGDGISDSDELLD